MRQALFRPGGVVHQIPPGESPQRDRAVPEGDPARPRRPRERPLQAGVARGRQVHCHGLKLRRVGAPLAHGLHPVVYMPRCSS